MLCCSHISSFLSFTPRGCTFFLVLVNICLPSLTRTPSLSVNLLPVPRRKEIVRKLCVVSWVVRCCALPMPGQLLLWLVTIHLKSGFRLYRDSKTCNIIDFVSRYTRKCLFLCIVTPLYRALAFLLIRRCSVAPISVPFCHSPQEDVPSFWF